MSILRPGCEARCPGCAHRLLSAEDSATQKQRWLQQRLEPWADRLVSLKAVSGEARWAYRDRVRLSAQWDGEQWHCGLLVRDELIAIPNCPVHSYRVRKVMQLLMPCLPPFSRFPLAFYVQAGAQATLVLKTHQLPELDWLTPTLRRQLETSGLNGLWLQLHPAAGRRLFSKNGWHLLWGQAFSRDNQGFRYGPTAFQQLLPELYQQAMDKAEAFLSPTAYDVVIDLYSGTGMTLRRWLNRGACTIGVELAGEAVECARHNGPEALILRGACAQRIPQLREWLETHAKSIRRRLLYVNPPRTGLELEILDWTIQDCRPDRMAYLSCSAGTLHRDLVSLTTAGYAVEHIVPYDFFPQTYHVETLVLLRRLA
ncbi:MAG: class I SAM-dependent RNA methyltransferase [Candidatus Competibacteraceae bacterium]|nr:class I SAM-dependent RNA methyltransferase [Candidatus Competibacteraceae bacterium]